MNEENLVNGIPLSRTAIVHDRRSQGSNSGTSVDRFKKKLKRAQKKAFEKSFSDGSMKDIAEGKTIDGSMPADTIEEYGLYKGQGGDRDMVHPGNDQFTRGDKVQRPQGGGGGGGAGEGEASDSGEGQDEFAFQISQDEYLDLLFEDLKLPNLRETAIAKAIKFKLKRNGFTNSGTPERLDAPRTVMNQKGRRIAVGLNRLLRAQSLVNKTLTYVDKRLDASTSPDDADCLKAAVQLVLDAEAEISAALDDVSTGEVMPSVQLSMDCVALSTDIVAAKRPAKKKLADWKVQLGEYLEELETVIARKRRSTVIDEGIDGKYANMSKFPQPSENAVMFCMMDVSGSMTQETKDLAKRFYIVLYLFLMRAYDDVEIVFIRHHTTAKEVDEQEFFYGQETGGTIVSSALVLMNEIQEERYPASDWNIYAAQASDGDNWGGGDTDQCVKLIQDMLEERVRYYVYVEITNYRHQEMWEKYSALAQSNPAMSVGHVRSKADIVPVFRDFFLPKEVQ